MRNYNLYFVLIFCVFVGSASAAEISGNIELFEKGSKSAIEREYADTVVYFVPKNPEKYKTIVDENKEIKMENKTYIPRVLPISTGTKVWFPNNDDILHNVFSTSRGNEFDLDLYGAGESLSQAFDKPGLVRIYCNVHHSMVAYILVFDTPFYSTLSKEGGFTLTDLPNTEGELFVWHPRAKLIRETVDLSESNSRQYELQLVKRRVPKHKNKDGISYREALKKKQRK